MKTLPFEGSSEHGGGQFGNWEHRGENMPPSQGFELAAAMVAISAVGYVEVSWLHRAAFFEH
jgi:hypothetical protein